MRVAGDAGVLVCWCVGWGELRCHFSQPSAKEKEKRAFLFVLAEGGSGCKCRTVLGERRLWEGERGCEWGGTTWHMKAGREKTERGKSDLDVSQETNAKNTGRKVDGLRKRRLQTRWLPKTFWS